ncbi:unnamed protein product [Effrenium voratum]|nr:unnamed protein product [Effrenium voratum]CAJ1434025.1 unnamed protein product [Effrenium voratum]
MSVHRRFAISSIIFLLGEEWVASAQDSSAICEALGVDLPRDSNEAFESAKRAKNLSFASACSGTLVLANTLLGGSGLLGMPAALAKAGYLLGLGLMVVFGLFSAFGCHLLQCSARRIGQAPCSFYTVSNAVVPRWTWLIDGAVMVKCFGVATSYLIIVGDLAPPALAHFGFQRPRWEVILVRHLWRDSGREGGEYSVWAPTCSRKCRETG